MIADGAQLLQRLIANPRETEWLEFKVNQFDQEDFGKYVSAIANAVILRDRHHGYLVYGVEDTTHSVVGTNIRLKAEKVGNDLFEHWLARLLHPSIAFDIIEVDHAGLHVEIVRISPAYTSPVRFKNETYIRIGSILRHIREFPEREMALWAAVNRISFERGIAAAHLSSQEIFSRFDCDGLFPQSAGMRLSSNARLQRLIQNGLIIDDEQGGYDATNLLAILCANDISEFPSLTNKTPRVIQYKGKSKIVGIDDVQGKVGFGISFGRLLKHIVTRVQHKEEMRHGQRVVVHSIPEIAIRELVANALIHQDLTAQGGPVIEIYEDRIVITNPGEPLMDPARLIDAPPRSRNERLAGFMRGLGHCEARGSGVDRAIEAIEKAVCPPPLFCGVEGFTVATLYAVRPFGSFSKEDRIRACYQHASIRLEARNLMGNASLRARFGLGDTQYAMASIVIRDAIDAGQIRPAVEGQGHRTAKYVPAWAVM